MNETTLRELEAAHPLSPCGCREAGRWLYGPVNSFGDEAVAAGCWGCSVWTRFHHGPNAHATAAKCWNTSRGAVPGNDTTLRALAEAALADERHNEENERFGFGRYAARDALFARIAEVEGGSGESAPRPVLVDERDSTPRQVLEDQLERSEAENRILRDAVGVSAATFKRALEVFGEILRERDWITQPDKWKDALREAAEKPFAALNALVDTDHLPDGQMVVMRVLDQQAEIERLRARLAALSPQPAVVDAGEPDRCAETETLYGQRVRCRHAVGHEGHHEATDATGEYDCHWEGKAL